MATKKWKCKVCGYIHEGDKAPAECPVCHVPASEFEELFDKKRGVNTGSNTYTIAYASVMVILVAALLAYTALSLKPLQLKNVEIDKKKQILASIHVPSTAADAESLYDKYVTEAYIVDANGEKVEGDAFKVDLAGEVSKEPQERKLPVFEAKGEDGEIKYILPVRGPGLWGPLWGYISLNSDRNSIYGTYFSHKGETPGLGAEIEKPFFQEQFEGKKIERNGKIVSIAIMKKGQTAANQDQVDALSGGTITSKGVEDMLLNCLLPYQRFLSNR